MIIKMTMIESIYVAQSSKFSEVMFNKLAISLTPAGTEYPDNTTSSFSIRELIGAIGYILERGKVAETSHN